MLKAFVAFLQLLVSLITSWRKQKERQDAQDSADHINADPAGEFTKRFGVRKLPDTKPDSTEASTPESRDS